MKLEDAINRTAKKILNNKLFLITNTLHSTSWDPNNLIIMYGLSNVPKQNYSPLRPQLAAFSQHSFIQPRKISGFHSLTPLTLNEFSVKNSVSLSALQLTL